MTIYERYGRLMEERQQEHEAHLRTIAVLRDVVQGKIPPARVLVTEDAWMLMPEDASDPVSPEAA